MVAARKHSPTPEAHDAFQLPEDYKPYVPVAKRRAQMLSQLGAKHTAKKVKTQEEMEREIEEELKEQEEDEERAREKARRERTLLQAAQEVKEQRALEGVSYSWVVFCMLTCFVDAKKSAVEREAEKEAALLAEMERAQKKLAGAQELAQGVTWTESLKTSCVAYQAFHRLITNSEQLESPSLYS